MKKTAFLATLTFMSAAFGYEAKITKGQLPADIEVMIQKASTDTNVAFSLNDFHKIEDREMATSRFQMYVQHNNLIPVARTAIRIWSDKKTNELIRAEMHLSENSKRFEKLLTQKYHKARFSPGAFKSKKLSKAISDLVAKEVGSHASDNRVLSMKFKDQWSNGELVREVEVRGRRGIHTITISLLKNVILEKSYSEFPQVERFHSMKANVFPMYEEVELTGEKLPYEVKELKFISTQLPDGGELPLGEYTHKTFSENLYNPILAETEVGQQNDIWSEASIRRGLEKTQAQLPLRTNTLGNGLLLQGKYATINLHPAAKGFKDINFPLKASVNHILSWGQDESGSWEAKAVSGLYGKTINSEEELLARVPERLPDHDATAYINSGFDEVQVYYGVTVLMDALSEMGFEDPELSTKPFHAFLFDPDISMKDNAYYYDNTINFTTYNPGSPNLARDNPTIWHELGHGVMDRLMGAHLLFGDGKSYGGLSEGMADFLAKIVVEHQTSGADFPGKNDFRIINNTGFYLTNEYHDEGEAYGGAMNDMLDSVLAKEGREGLYDFTDLTLEAMRLSRNHPALSPRLWFENMLYADELGSEVRDPGQYKQVILESLKSRNFAFAAEFKPAVMKVTSENGELTSSSPASRDRPLMSCGLDGYVSHDLKVELKAGDASFIKFPATVKVEYKKGALQGAIKWVGEEVNPTVYTVNSESELLTVPLKASMECETVNQPDGSCKDYAYLQIFNAGEKKPIAKKRFYLQLNKANCQK